MDDKSWLTKEDFDRNQYERDDFCYLTFYANAAQVEALHMVPWACLSSADYYWESPFDAQVWVREFSCTIGDPDTDGSEIMELEDVMVHLARESWGMNITFKLFERFATVGPRGQLTYKDVLLRTMRSKSSRR